MNLKTKFTAPALLVSVLGLIVAAPASAQYTIGQLNPPFQAGVCSPVATVQTAVQPGTAAYRIPPGESGVITGWQTRTATNAGTAKLLVMRPAGAASEYKVLAADGPHPVPAFTSPSFGGLRIPVQPGDAIGLYASATNCTSWFPGSAFTNVTFGVGFDPAPGAAINAIGTGTQFALEVAATVEIDKDGDGYGDETQDGCPDNPATQAQPCVAPPAADPGPAADSSAPPGAPSSVSAPSTPAPRLSLFGRWAQDALRQGGVVEIVATDQAATLRATGNLTIPGAKRPLPLLAATATARAGARTRLVLGLGATAKRRLAAALGRGRQVRAQVNVGARADAGAATASQQIVIEPAGPRH